jgi:phenylpyruvate tautomerase PptA (4-oxalocrotonate tautomerase family)
MPIARIHVLQGRYDEQRLGHVSTAVQDALIETFGNPAEVVKPVNVPTLVRRHPAKW